MKIKKDSAQEMEPTIAEFERKWIQACKKGDVEALKKIKVPRKEARREARNRRAEGWWESIKSGMWSLLGDNEGLGWIYRNGLEEACKKGHVEVVRAFRKEQWGGKISQWIKEDRDEIRKDGLDYALELGHRDVARELIEIARVEGRGTGWDDALIEGLAKNGWNEEIEKIASCWDRSRMKKEGKEKQGAVWELRAIRWKVGMAMAIKNGKRDTLVMMEQRAMKWYNDKEMEKLRREVFDRAIGGMVESGPWISISKEWRSVVDIFIKENALSEMEYLGEWGDKMGTAEEMKECLKMSVRCMPPEFVKKIWKDQGLGSVRERLEVMSELGKYESRSKMISWLLEEGVMNDLGVRDWRGLLSESMTEKNRGLIQSWLEKQELKKGISNNEETWEMEAKNNEDKESFEGKNKRETKRL